ncbi:ADP-heptose:LPS heptosyl transferase I [Vibrio thalassae]|uniref:ADP-heptose:LPS heptosyl transferase I n=1 Tax=Vibrio thalassae TaxID=1243014 RepID=A0A240EI28_9VIBR|nr:glycosyltransferase family 9 protein [Vibrio thalassae]SNX47839.1 ADP-heptose:LPS heptosyl transferase I [Vibrio thalassae]
MRQLISRLQLLRDQIRQKLGIALFDKARSTNSLDPKSIQHVVILRVDAKLGDSFVSSFVAKDIKAFNPAIKVTVVTTSAMRSLFLDYWGADEVIELKKRPKYRDITNACRQIGDCDLLVSLTLNPKMKDLFFLSQCRAKHIAGLKDSLKIVDIKLGEKTRSMHFAERFAYLLEEIGITAHARRYVIPQDQHSIATADSYIAAHSATPFCVLNAYGSGNSRKLNGESIKRLVTMVKRHDKHLNVILISSPDTVAITNEYIKQYQLDALHYDVSRSILDVASLVARSEFVISVDTAIVHMATGLNKPQLALYNPDPDNFNQWHPNSDRAYTSVALETDIPDINMLDWNDIEQKLKQIIDTIG